MIRVEPLRILVNDVHYNAEGADLDNGGMGLTGANGF